MSFDPKLRPEREALFRQDLDQLPDEYLEAEYPDLYRARRDRSIRWRDYGPWY